MPMPVHVQLACVLAGSALECQLNELIKLCGVSLKDGAQPHPCCKAVELAAASLTCTRCNLCQLHIEQPGNDIMAPRPNLQGTAAVTGQSDYQRRGKRSDALMGSSYWRPCNNGNADRAMLEVMIVYLHSQHWTKSARLNLQSLVIQSKKE